MQDELLAIELTHVGDACRGQAMQDELLAIELNRKIAYPSGFLPWKHARPPRLWSPMLCPRCCAPDVVPRMLCRGCVVVRRPMGYAESVSAAPQ